MVHTNQVLSIAVNLLIFNKELFPPSIFHVLAMAIIQFTDSTSSVWPFTLLSILSI